MKRMKILIGVTAMAMSAAVWATEPAKSIWGSESSEQKCGRWADYDNLKDEKRSEFMKECLFDLRVTEVKQEDGGGD